MSHVDFKKYPCPVPHSLEFSCRFSNDPMSHVNFKKSHCRGVKFKGQGPHSRAPSLSSKSAATTLPFQYHHEYVLVMCIIICTIIAYIQGIQSIIAKPYVGSNVS